MRKREFELERGTLRYWVSENDEETAQLVFLPGLTADHRLFDKQLDYFAQRARCLVWDPPSHGESRPFPLDWSLDDLALMLEQILSREGFERPILIGQSMGGYVSQAFIRLFPDRACGFVSVDSCPLDRSYYTAIELWALKHVKGIYRAIPWKSLCSMGSKGCATSEYGRTLMREMMLCYDKPSYVDMASWGFLALACAIRADRSYPVECPTLLICGEKDAAGSAKRYNRAWSKCSRLPIEWIEGAGHNSNTDAPDRVNELIERFLVECAGRD